VRAYRINQFKHIATTCFNVFIINRTHNKERMKFMFQLSLILLIQFLSNSGSAQETLLTDNQVYGLDQLLHNGKQYTYFLPAGTSGSPFFHGPEYEQGSVQIRGISYKNLLLNYDVYNQQLILRFKTLAGNEQLMAISNAWLEAFTFGNKQFELLALQDTMRQIYQVIGTGDIRVLYSFTKILSLDKSYGATNFNFSKPTRESVLLIGSRPIKYKNNRSFIALFSPVNQPILKKFLRQQKINVKKANDLQMVKLMNFCNTLQEK